MSRGIGGQEAANYLLVNALRDFMGLGPLPLETSKVDGKCRVCGGRFRRFRATVCRKCELPSSKPEVP